MGPKPKFDFSGYATKPGLKCSDGRVILQDAFKHNDGQKVPLVWQHLHDDPANILGHAILEHRNDGTYTYCTFNDTEAGKNAKELVAHGDITALSIYANALKQKGTAVIHGMIREVSLVLSGANPGALIDNLAFSHGDGADPTVDETEAIIYTGLPLSDNSIEHASDTDDQKKLSDNFTSLTEKQKMAIYQAALENMVAQGTITEPLQHAKHSADATVQEVFDTLDETQKTVVYAMIAQALSEGEDVEHSDTEGELSMKTNVFDKSTEKPGDRATLTHDQIGIILTDAKRCGSLKDAFLAHATSFGIENIDVLFPDARAIRDTPDLIKRDDTWVTGFLAAIYKTPFSRIKSLAADLTADEARAKGYITGARKKEEVFPVLKRTTIPTTVNI